MTRIVRDELGTKFFFGDKEKPFATIYKGSDIAIVSDEIATGPEEAREMAKLLNIAAMIIHSVQNPDQKDNVYNVMYKNEVMHTGETVLYSPQKILKNIFTDSIITVSRKDKIKFKLTTFDFTNGTLIANYQPVVW